MTLSADLLRGYTDTLIMRQLAAEDGYGYGISRTLAEKSGGVGLHIKEVIMTGKGPHLLRAEGLGAHKVVTGENRCAISWNLNPVVDEFTASVGERGTA